MRGSGFEHELCEPRPRKKKTATLPTEGKGCGVRGRKGAESLENNEHRLNLYDGGGRPHRTSGNAPATTRVEVWNRNAVGLREQFSDLLRSFLS